MSKKVLIITYYWPPAGGPGVQRWLKFVKYLPEFGVEPIVFVPENPSYPITDTSLETDLSEDVEVLKFPISEPYKWAKLFSKQTKNISKGVIPKKANQGLISRLLLYIRGNFFIPDARVGWVSPSVKFLENYLQTNQIETVVTTGPPHSLHLIGLNLKARFPIKWIADFRDPWTTIDYHSELKLTEASKRKHKKLEKEVLQTCDEVVVTSKTTKEEFENITSKPISVITNGYDTEKVGQVMLDSKFSMSHIGSLLSHRNPEILWEVLQELTQEDETFATDLQINLVGLVSASVLGSISNYGLNKYLNNVGYVSHKASVVYQKQSQLLLLIEANKPEKRCIIPGKLFEYMTSNRPILAFGPANSDVSQILKETNTGQYFLYSDKEHLKHTIRSFYESYKQNALQTFPVGLQKYSRKALTQELSKLL